MKATIDREGCIGCGLCVQICPGVFRMAEDDLAEAYSEIGEDESEALAARDNCPVAVITIEG